jgi:hypothetical protein
VWKKGAGPFQRMSHATGDIVCLVEVPPTYKTLEKRVLKTPAATHTIQIPAQYRTIKKRVLRTPARTRTVQVPGEYDTIRVKKMIAPAYLKRMTIPAQYDAVNKQVKVRNGKMEWRPVLCQTNVTPDIVRALQKALKTANFDPGPIDGVLGRQTLVAMESYQQANGLPVGGLTLETLETLRLSTSDRPAKTRPEPLLPDGEHPDDSLLTPDSTPQMDPFDTHDQPERKSGHEGEATTPEVLENPDAPQDVK